MGRVLGAFGIFDELGRSGRTDCGIHVTMTSHDQYLSQVRSSDLAQLEESDISPMILRSLVAGRSFARLPFLCPPHPMVQTHTKEKMFLHGILDTKAVTRMGDMPQRAWTCRVNGHNSCTRVLKEDWRTVLLS